MVLGVSVINVANTVPSFVRVFSFQNRKCFPKKIFCPSMFLCWDRKGKCQVQKIFALLHGINWRICQGRQFLPHRQLAFALVALFLWILIMIKKSFILYILRLVVYARVGFLGHPMVSNYSLI